MKKYVIYSAIIGGYDEIKQPSVTDERFDYVLFTNNQGGYNIGVWQVREINYDNDIQTKIARYVKTHPLELLPNYVASVWIDASVTIDSPYIYERTIQLMEKNTSIATHIHPELNCIYKEMLGIDLAKWECHSVILKWGNFLRKEDFPRELGTWETRVVFRNHLKNDVKKINTLWWWCIENYSRRDQLSFQYVLWKIGVECCSFLPLDCDVKNSIHFKVADHKKCSNKYLEKDKILDSWLLRYYYKHADKQKEIENVYYWIYGRKTPILWEKLLGQFYRIKHLILHLLGMRNIYHWELDDEKK